ncbi:MAG: C40 family peptidase [Bacteroidota bacterium]|nr:C40 family peptidase [Bacteroidota bacterium]MDP4234274.1 C40 family peptidase [Bacteroidota bacterium]MDP4243464.1 C40 family peptidase [Bacteroidota bacterium]MDP4289166.1 C40 family peptidase [Bacteroidota bacterium]
MTPKIIRRWVSLLPLALLAIAIMSASSTDATARKHKAGRPRGNHSHGKHGKIAHNARRHGHRYARLSQRKHHPLVAQKALSTEEKEEIVQKIRDLSKASVDDTTAISSAEIQSEIAQAAREEQAEDDVSVSIEQFFKARPGAIGDTSFNPDLVRQRSQDFTLYDETDPSHAAQRSDIMAEIIDWIGTRYVFGGGDRTGIDCSAFTREVFNRAFGVELPRTAYMQWQLGEPVSREGLQFGDLVFFHTAGYAPITHVGIYIGEGLFANAACSRGVTVGSLESTYWSKHFAGARRLFANSGMASAKTAPITNSMATTGGE